MISSLVSFLIRLLEILIIAHVLLSYFLSPYHPIRATIMKVVEPLLSPIRRLIPTVGGLDFSPLILLILIQILGQLLLSLLRSSGL